jgi:hypothetical protein
MPFRLMGITKPYLEMTFSRRPEKARHRTGEPSSGSRQRRVRAAVSGRKPLARRA